MTRFVSASDVSFSQRPPGSSSWLTGIKLLLSCVWALVGMAVPYIHGQERTMCAAMKKAVLVTYLLCRTLFNLILSILGTCIYLL